MFRYPKGVILSCVVALLFCAAGSSSAQTISSEWVFFESPQNWESYTPDGEMPTRVAPTVVIVLYPNGDYAAVSGLLVEKEKGKVTLSKDDPYVVRVGVWKQDGNKISASSNVVFRTRRSTMKRADQAQTKEFVVKSVNGQTQLQQVGGQSFERLKQFDDFANLEVMVKSRGGAGSPN